MTAPLEFEFEGKAVPARSGQSIAAALIEAGFRDFRETASGQRRGVFCGMGICQDCLVEIEGRPNQRACMTKVSAGLDVRRQSALPRLEGVRPGASAAAPRHETPEVLVIGGGAGGLTAAIAARRAGAATLLLDERNVAGGQYFKQSPAELAAAPLDEQQRLGGTLVRQAEAAGVEVLSGAEVWGAFAGPVYYAQRNGQALLVEPRATVVATGAYERPRMVPGWHLPGVMTTGAAQTLWRSYRTLPGRRCAVFGSGPLNHQVALELIEGGAEMSLLAESASAPWARPMAALDLMTANPGLALKGGAVLLRLAAKGAAPQFRTVLDRIETRPDGLLVTARGPTGETRAVEVDAVCMSYGFQPQNEILRLLRASMTYDQAMDQLRPVRSETMETSVPGLFAVGDCCGLGGAPAAQDEGHIAGAAAAVFSGASKRLPDVSPVHRRLRRHRRFQQALWRLHEAAASTLEDIDPDVLICRCEEVTKAELDASIGTGIDEIGSVKRATRLGMGSCQGRYCAPAVAPYLASKSRRPVEDLSFFAPRAPIKPVSIEAVLAAREAHGET